MYTKSGYDSSKSISKKLSSFYVEIKEDFLPEPLILTILLDFQREDGEHYHLSIEKDPKLSPRENELSSDLFGGNKGYQWLTAFIGLIHTIRHQNSSLKESKQPKPYILMAQYKLKLLTILTNLLITHLSFISSEKTHDFVTNIITLVSND